MRHRTVQFTISITIVFIVVEHSSSAYAPKAAKIADPKRLSVTEATRLLNQLLMGYDTDCDQTQQVRLFIIEVSTAHHPDSDFILILDWEIELNNQ